MPVGYEYGFHRELNVVKTRPEDWEQPSFDITDFIRTANDLKRSTPILQVDGETEALWGIDGPVLCLRKTWNGETLLTIMNKDWRERHHVELHNVRDLAGGTPD